MYKKKVKSRNVVFGDKFLFCIPLSEKTTDDLISAARRVAELQPDIVEWRVDAMDFYPDAEKILESAKRVREAIGDIPVIFTTRYHEEGGFKTITEEEKFSLIQVVYPSGYVDIVDIELKFADIAHRLIEEIKESGLKVIVSYHNLKEVLPSETVIEILKKQQDSGGDIVKSIFHMDTFRQLVLLGDAVEQAKARFLEQPVILGGDGAMGMLTRLAAEGIGSTMTYVAGAGAASHPSQMEMNDLKQMRKKMKLG